jgi:hypothetical protein
MDPAVHAAALPCLGGRLARTIGCAAGFSLDCADAGTISHLADPRAGGGPASHRPRGRRHGLWPSGSGGTSGDGQDAEKDGDDTDALSPLEAFVQDDPRQADGYNGVE